PLVGVQRVVVHRDHAEQVVVVLGDGLARPVLVDVADLEVLEVAPERPVVGRAHDRKRSTRSTTSSNDPTWSWSPGSGQKPYGSRCNGCIPTARAPTTSALTASPM